MSGFDHLRDMQPRQMKRVFKRTRPQKTRSKRNPRGIGGSSLGRSRASEDDLKREPTLPPTEKDGMRKIHSYPTLGARDSSGESLCSAQDDPDAVFCEQKFECISVSPNSKQAVIGGREMLRILEIDTAEKTLKTKKHFQRRRTLRYSAVDVDWHPKHEARFLSSTSDGIVVVWNLDRQNIRGGMREFQFRGHELQVNCCRWHLKDENILASGSQDYCVKLWDLRQEKETHTFRYHDKCRCVRFDPFNEHAFSVSYDSGEFLIWDRRMDKPRASVTAHQQLCVAMDWHPNQQGKIATGGLDRTIKVWDVNAEKPTCVTQINTMDVTYKVFWASNNHIASSCGMGAGFDKMLHFWSVDKVLVPVGSLKSHQDVIIDFRIIDGTHVLTCSKDKYIRLSSIDQIIRPRQLLPKSSVCFSPSNDLLSSSVKIDSSCDPLPCFHIAELDDSIQYTEDIDVHKNLQDSGHFVTLAGMYKIRSKGESIRDICRYNRECAKRVGHHAAVQLWNVLLLLFPEEEQLQRRNVESILANEKKSDRNDTQSVFSSDVKQSTPVQHSSYLPGVDENFHYGCNDDSDLSDDDGEDMFLAPSTYLPSYDANSEDFTGFQEDFNKNLIQGLFDSAVDVGDVQSGAMIILTLRLDSNGEKDEKMRRRECLAAYLDMLERFRLQNEAALIRKLTEDKKIRSLTENGTLMKLRCAKPRCKGMIEEKRKCEECGSYVECFICQCILLGPLLWSSDCGHAFHLKCARKWFSSNIRCPCR